MGRVLHFDLPSTFYYAREAVSVESSIDVVQAFTARMGYSQRHVISLLEVGRYLNEWVELHQFWPRQSLHQQSEHPVAKEFDVI